MCFQQIPVMMVEGEMKRNLKEEMADLP